MGSPFAIFLFVLNEPSGVPSTSPEVRLAHFCLCQIDVLGPGSNVSHTLSHDTRRSKCSRPLKPLYPVRAEHAFPPTQAVNSLRACSLPVQSPLAFVCGPREARGRLRRRPPSAAASLRSAWLSSARCFVRGEHIRGEANPSCCESGGIESAVTGFAGW